MSTIRVLLASDQPHISAGVRSLAEGVADIRLVGEVNGKRNVEEAVAQLRPDVVLLDVNLLGPESIRTIHRLARAYPGLQVLALAACDREYRSRVPEMLAQTPLVNVSANGDGLATLTPREREILSLIGTGATNSEIAEALCISKRTVETHVSNIYGKLRFAGRPQAVRYAVEHGLVDNQS